MRTLKEGLEFVAQVGKNPKNAAKWMGSAYA